MKPIKQAIGTVSTYSYLARALVLATSFLEHNADSDVVVLIADMSQLQVDRLELHLSNDIKIKFLGIDSLQYPEISGMRSYFSTFEYCCAVKAFLMDNLLNQRGYGYVILLDPDIQVFSSFDTCWEKLSSTGMLLTPHTESVYPADGLSPDDWELVTSGFINAGFWGANAQHCQEALQWMKKMVVRYGFFSPENNLYSDQLLMSCLPWYFSKNTQISRDPGLNVAYWNLHERMLSETDGVYKVNMQKIVFFHYSGFTEIAPHNLSMHTSRVFTSLNQVLLPMQVDYAKKIQKQQIKLTAAKPDMPTSSLTIVKRIAQYKKAEYAIPAVINKFQFEWLNPFKHIFLNVMDRLSL